MGEMVSRWYMGEKTVLGQLNGAKNIRQWIGIAPVNHGIADTIFWGIQGTPAGKAKDIKSDTLAKLNYHELKWNFDTWKTVQEKLPPGVIHRTIVGTNEKSDIAPYPLRCETCDKLVFSRGFWLLIMDKTQVFKKDNKKREVYHYRTLQGDGLVPFYLSHLQGLKGIDCIQGVNHIDIPRNPEVINLVINYLKNPLSESKNNIPHQYGPGEDPCEYCNGVAHLPILLLQGP
jgi:hypothetical protein